MNHAFREIIEDCPVIATVKDMESLEKSFETDSQIIFILFGDICNISEIVERVKTEGRIAMVHLDLVSGFDGREIADDFIRHNTEQMVLYPPRPHRSIVRRNWDCMQCIAFLCWIPVRWKISDARVRQASRTASRSYLGLCRR